VTVKPSKNGKWLVQIDRKDIPRIRKSFNDEKSAHIFEREYLANHQIKKNEYQDPRTLTELINLWYRYHGINLAAPEQRLRAIISLANGLGNPQACRLTPEMLVDFRFKRLSEGLAPKTFNNLHGYLSAIFRKLRKLKVIDFENPIDEVDFIKIHERQLSYLSKDQIDELMETIEAKTINPSTWFVTQLCLRTGARWGEVEQLRCKQLHNGRITYEFTKSKRTRTIPIDPHFYQQLITFNKGNLLYILSRNLYKILWRKSHVSFAAKINRIVGHAFFG
jgi:integrase